MLLDQLRVGELAEAHSLSNTVDLFKMAMKKVPRDKAIDRVANVTESPHVYETAVVGQVERKLVVADALVLRVAANNLTDVDSAVLLGFQ